MNGVQALPVPAASPGLILYFLLNLGQMQLQLSFAQYILWNRAHPRPARRFAAERYFYEEIVK